MLEISIKPDNLRVKVNKENSLKTVFKNSADIYHNVVKENLKIGRNAGLKKMAEGLLPKLLETHVPFCW